MLPTTTTTSTIITTTTTQKSGLIRSLLDSITMSNLPMDLQLAI